MEEAEEIKLRNMLLQSLYDYHFANDGASYRLPKAMLSADVNSEKAIEYLVENGYATDSGEGTNELVLSITEKGIESIENES